MFKVNYAIVVIILLRCLSEYEVLKERASRHKNKVKFRLKWVLKMLE